MKHYAIAAKAWDKKSLDAVKEGYMDGYVTKNEYANTLRAYHQRLTDLKSDSRERSRLMNELMGR